MNGENSVAIEGKIDYPKPFVRKPYSYNSARILLRGLFICVLSYVIFMCLINISQMSVSIIEMFQKLAFHLFYNALIKWLMPFLIVFEGCISMNFV